MSVANLIKRVKFREFCGERERERERTFLSAFGVQEEESQTFVTMAAREHHRHPTAAAVVVVVAALFALLPLIGECVQQTKMKHRESKGGIDATRAPTVSSHRGDFSERAESPRYSDLARDRSAGG